MHKTREALDEQQAVMRPTAKEELIQMMELHELHELLRVLRIRDKFYTLLDKVEKEAKGV